MRISGTRSPHEFGRREVYVCAPSAGRRGPNNSLQLIPLIPFLNHPPRRSIASRNGLVLSYSLLVRGRPTFRWRRGTAPVPVAD